MDRAGSTMYHPATHVSVDSFESLLTAQLEGLMRQALGYTRARSAAEDLVQETALRALRFREQFTMGTNFRAWVSTILAHTFIHGYRHGQRERQVLGSGGQADVAAHLGLDGARAPHTDPSYASLTMGFGDEVTLALANLPEDFRRVVVLCDVEGHSYKEIAALLGAPIGTVMSRLHRARRLLARQLEGLALSQGIGRAQEMVALAAKVAV